jgi:hypothetical protein
MHARPINGRACRTFLRMMYASVAGPTPALANAHKCCGIFTLPPVIQKQPVRRDAPNVFRSEASVDSDQYKGIGSKY